MGNPGPQLVPQNRNKGGGGGASDEVSDQVVNFFVAVGGVVAMMPVR